MDSSFQVYLEWAETRKRQVNATAARSGANGTVRKPEIKWQPPAMGTFKINMDASVFPSAQIYSVGMVLRNHEDTFMACRNYCFFGEVSMFETEAVIVREALSWITDMQMQGDEVTMELGSQLTVKAFLTDSLNFLEVGEVIESCKIILESLHRILVVFIRKNANKVAL